MKAGKGQGPVAPGDKLALEKLDDGAVAGRVAGEKVERRRSADGELGGARDHVGHGAEGIETVLDPLEGADGLAVAGFGIVRFRRATAPPWPARPRSSRPWETPARID